MRALFIVRVTREKEYANEKVWHRARSAQCNDAMMMMGVHTHKPPNKHTYARRRQTRLMRLATRVLRNEQLTQLAHARPEISVVPEGKHISECDCVCVCV